MKVDDLIRFFTLQYKHEKKVANFKRPVYSLKLKREMYRHIYTSVVATDDEVSCKMQQTDKEKMRVVPDDEKKGNVTHSLGSSCG
jgi:hypothetical protein